MEIIDDIKPIGVASRVVHAPFDKALESLTENGYDVISLPQNAQLRIQQGKNSYISKNGNWTREGILYVPNGKPKLVRNSPILNSAREATEAHRNGNEFYPTPEQVEKALVDSVDFPTQNIEIPADRFTEEPLTIYAFGGEEQARAYGEFLKNAGIQKMSVWAVDKGHVNKQSQPFARQMWLWYLDLESLLIGYYWFLDNDYWLRGVKVGAEGTAQNSESYTPKQISKVLNELKICGLETQILDRLKR
ncbi:MAG: hypothetical protein AABX79_01440 [Nanoarchaeota archaeon]